MGGYFGSNYFGQYYFVGQLTTSTPLVEPLAISLKQENNGIFIKQDSPQISTRG